VTTLGAHGLRVRLGSRLVLDDVALEAGGGELVALVGPSGSGKTTLLQVLAGELAPDEGEVRVDGSPLRPGDAAHTARLGRVLQLHSLVPVLTAGENVELALRARGVAGAAARERAEQALDRVGLGDLAGRLATRLSGGQQQRVAVARALAPRPAVVLADEPTSELDAATRDVVVAELRQEAAAGALVLVATHDAAVARVCDRRISLAAGRVLAS
jgi:putative ABC transport system ATP-binding protein